MKEKELPSGFSVEDMTEEIFVIAFTRSILGFTRLSLGLTRLSWNLWCFSFLENLKAIPVNFEFS